MSGKTGVLEINGEVVLDNVVELRKVLLGALTTGDAIALVVDLSHVPYIDSAGIAVLIEALAAARGRNRRFALSGLRDEARGLLEMNGLTELFETYPSREEAERALG